jgi:glycogen(starch) synthase
MRSGLWSGSGEVKRVLMTCDAVGGVWTYMLELVRGLGRVGVEVLVAAMGPPPSPEQRVEAAKLDNLDIVHRSLALEWMDAPWSDVDAGSDWLLDLASEFEPDMVHLNGYAHASLPWPAPVLIVAHSCVLTWWRAVKGENAPARYDEYRRRVTHALRSAFVVTPTNSYRHQLAREYGFEPSGVTIANARSSTGFAPNSLHKEHFIFSAGRLWDEAKNLAMLDTIAPGVEWPIKVAGDEVLPGSGRFCSSELRLLGRLDSKDLATTLDRAAIYAAPAKYEPFGLSILEAALSGCALLLSDIPTLRELWSDCAEFVPYDDPNAWMKGLNASIRDKHRRERLQSAAREAAEAYSVQQQVDSYMEVYLSLLGAPSGSAKLTTV